MRLKTTITLSLWLTLISGLILVIALAPTTTQALSPTSTPTSAHTSHHTSDFEGTVWVADEYGNSVTVIDAAQNEVITTLTGIEAPHNIQASPDGKTIWAISGHDSLAVQIDASTYTVVGAVPTGNHPAHIVLAPNNQTAYVTNSEDNTVSVIDVASMEVIATIPVGNYPHGMRPSPDGKWLYVANMQDTTLSVIETSTNTKVADIEVGKAPVQVGFSPDGEFLYASLNGENALVKVEVATRQVLGKVDVGIGPVQVFVTPDNRYILVANQGTQENPSTTVSVIDAASFSVTATIETGRGAHGIVVDPSGKYAYVTNIYDNTTAVLDIAEQVIVAVIPTGEGPNGITFSSLVPSAPIATTLALELPEHSEGEAPATAGGHDEHHVETPTPIDEHDMDGMAGMDGNNSSGGHAMQPINSEGVLPAEENAGGQPLEYQLVDGVKVFEITARPVIWNILDDVTVTAWTYNGTVPGPMIRVTEGDQVRIVFKNELPEPTTIHWHGVEVPNAMDGVPGVTQDAVEPGESFTYEFVAKPAGTFMYHSHYASDTQVSLGLYAPFIIDPVESSAPAPDVDMTLMLSEWRVINGETFPAMPMSGMEPNYFTINGKAFPSTETINVKVGQRVRLRLISIGQFAHPMHLHGMAFKVVATDGWPVPEAAQLTKDTINVAPGERYDIEFVATEPGQWMFHCHILHHTTNDGVDGGGLMLTINVSE